MAIASVDLIRSQVLHSALSAIEDGDELEMKRPAELQADPLLAAYEIVDPKAVTTEELFGFIDKVIT
jgi:hypothetical protein